MPRGCNNFKDITGQRFGSLVAIRRANNDEIRKGTSYRGAQWVCKCDCGKELVVPSALLLRKIRAKKNCGDIEKHPRTSPLYRDLIGQTFGGLYVLKIADKKDWKFNQKSWLCICECEKECVATTAQLTHGLMTSCGCGAHRRNHMYGNRRGGRPKNATTNNNDNWSGSL